MFDRNQTKLLFIILSLFILSGFLLWQGYKYSTKPIAPTQTLLKPQANQPSTPILVNSPIASVSASTEVSGRVSRVIDGDTIEVNLNGQKQKLRYIGINTPETVDPRKSVQCFGKEASDENKKLVEGQLVYLEKDVSETDKYGRLLRYVYLPTANGERLFINDYLVRQGFAQVLTYPPDIKYNQQFLTAQREARENKRGLWQKC